MTVRSNTRANKRAELPAVGRVSLRGADILVGVLALVGIIHIISMLGVESYRSVMSSREIQRLSSDVAQLEAEVAQLQAVVEYGDTPAYREQLARCAGFIMPDEVRYLTLIEGLERPVPLANPCAGQVSGF
jgi:outer membrane murein-binding lipoprotein Lpp